MLCNQIVLSLHAVAVSHFPGKQNSLVAHQCNVSIRMYTVTLGYTKLFNCLVTVSSLLQIVNNLSFLLNLYNGACIFTIEGANIHVWLSFNLFLCKQIHEIYAPPPPQLSIY